MSRAVGVLFSTVALAAAAAALTLGPVAGAGAAGSGGPVCPEGSTYNKETKKCETAPTVVCPANTTLQSDGSCTGAPVERCPEGYSEVPNSPGGERICSGPPPCPEGYRFEGLDECVGPMIKECPSGTSPSPDDSTSCEASPVMTCPDGFALNETTGMCEADPIGGGGGGSGTGGGGGGTPGGGGGGGTGGGGGGGKPPR